MNTNTTDFTGTYDYPATEAELVVKSFLEYWPDYTNDEIIQRVIKERDHWLKVFGNDEQGKADMKRFCQVFNDTIGAKLDFFM